ncbi:MAG: peptidylprolyl isomerase [Planctomycetota bacterium]|jgi:peptidyl-prolyl cis-trans isomerase C
MRTYSLNLRITVCIAIFLAVAGLSCKKTDTDKSSTTATDSGADNVAVTINGVEIPESEIDRLVKPQLQMLAQQSAQLPPQFAEQYARQLREQVLEQTIRRQLLDEKVKEANIVITDEQVTNKITEIAAGQREPLSLDEFRKTMEQYGQSFENVKEDVRKGLARNQFMEAQWAGKIDVTEEDARKYYDENLKQFEQPEQVRASHILIKPELVDPNTNPNADPNEAKAKARTKAEDLLKQLKDGADFAELAKTHSSCPSAPQGGDLDFFPRGQTTPAFENTAFELEIGQISEVVETEYGYHIIKATERKEASTITFDQAKDEIIRQLTQNKQLELAEEYIESLKARANIVYPPGKEPPAEVNTP